MLKINLNGQDWVTLDEVAYAIHSTRAEIERTRNKWQKEWTAEEAVDFLVKWLYRVEYENAKTEWEKDRVLEVPGRYVIQRHVRLRDGESVVEYFREWNAGDEPAITEKEDKAMTFDYYSQAKTTISILGDKGWKIIDIGRAAQRHSEDIMHRMLQALDKMTHKGCCLECGISGVCVGCDEDEEVRECEAEKGPEGENDEGEGSDAVQ